MDPIANMLTMIKNAGAVGKDSVLVPYSKLKHEICKILQKDGYIESVNKKSKKNKDFLEIAVMYRFNGRPRIEDVKRVSKPSRRTYVNTRSIRPVKDGYGSLIISTPKGVLNDQDAKAQMVGGEALFEIW